MKILYAPAPLSGVAGGCLAPPAAEFPWTCSLNESKYRGLLRPPAMGEVYFDAASSPPTGIPPGGAPPKGDAADGAPPKEGGVPGGGAP